MEVLLRVVDKVNSNCPVSNSNCLKAGDCVVLVENGHNWGKVELVNPHWRIIKLPLIPLESAQTWLDPEDGYTPESQDHTRRKYKFLCGCPDLDTELRAYLEDSTRVSPYYTINQDLAALTGSTKLIAK